MRDEFFKFCERLKESGVYQGYDTHLYIGDKCISRQDRNGYYITRKMYKNFNYTYMEHRIIWYLHYDEFDLNLQINHKDFDRTNNDIENLELVTAKENIHYTIDAGRARYLKGVDSPKARFSEKEVQMIRYLSKYGWKIKAIRSLFPDIKYDNVVGRVINGSRYGEVLDASDVMAIYPLIVELTKNKSLSKDEAIKNCLLGLSGEVGEVLDLYKKHYYHGHDLDIDHVMMEMGDILYYITWLCIECGFDLSEIMYANMNKLTKRYPDGFSSEKSLNRKQGDI